MAKLNLMRNIEDFEAYKISVWRREVGEGNPPHGAPNKFPCLVKIVPIIRYGQELEFIDRFTIICTKDEAKRIVYPKTNKNRSRMEFTIIEGDLMDAMIKYMAQIIDNVGDIGRNSDAVAQMDPAHPMQRGLLDKAISELDGVSGLALVTSKVYVDLNRLRLVDFYIVDEAEARDLVYWNKRLSAKLKRLYPDYRYHGAKAEPIKKRQEIEIDFDWSTWNNTE